jgi:hypothetical protein
MYVHKISVHNTAFSTIHTHSHLHSQVETALAILSTLLCTLFLLKIHVGLPPVFPLQGSLLFHWRAIRYENEDSYRILFTLTHHIDPSMIPCRDPSVDPTYIPILLNPPELHASCNYRNMFVKAVPLKIYTVCS